MSEVFVQTDEQRLILETVRKFVAEAITPVAIELDRQVDPADCFSWEIVDQTDRVGIRTMTLSEEWGGMGADSLTTAMVIEEIAKGDMGIAVVIAQTLKLAQIFQKAMTEDREKNICLVFGTILAACWQLELLSPRQAPITSYRIRRRARRGLSGVTEDGS